jgi:hypothetical protein
MQVVKAALGYWGVVFALGFLLGTLRVLWIAPALDETRAVLIELPVMLGASWLAARSLVRRFGVGSVRAALGMGALAIVLLMASEAGLAVVMGQSLAQWLDAMARMPGALGLAGQAAFAAMPVLVRKP